MKLTLKKTSTNKILLYLIILSSFMSYEYTLYRVSYNLMLAIILALGGVVFVLNIPDRKIFSCYYKNLKNNPLVHILSILLLLSTLISSFKHGLVTVTALTGVFLTIVSIYIFYLFIPILVVEELDKNIKKLVIFITFFSIIAIIIALRGNFLGYFFTDYNRVASIFFDPNYFGVLAGIGFLLGVHQKGIYKAFSILNLIAVYCSGSRTAMISLIFVMGIFYFYNKKLNVKSIFTFFCFVLLVYYLIGLLLDIGFFRVHQGLNLRDHLWKLSFELLKEEPLWGFGYRVVGDLIRIKGGSHVSFHNSYLDYITMYGIPSFILNIAVMAKALYSGVKNKFSQSIIKCIFFLLICANSISINLGGVGATSLLLTLFLGGSNISRGISFSEKGVCQFDKNIICEK